jgi:hypothetical protein
MAFLREHCLIWATIDLLRRIRGRSFNLGRQLHLNSWFNHDLRRRSLTQGWNSSTHPKETSRGYDSMNLYK